nr:GIY-YIG nuclease family protein [Neobacillus sp. Marseille-Q6967]
MGHELLSKGIYVILNKDLRLVYVGQTQRNFVIRWTEHLIRTPQYVNNFERIKLFLHEDTKFLILKKMDEQEFVRKDFYRLEREAYEFYKSKNWGIVSHHANNDPEYRSNNTEDDRLVEHYKKAINHMGFILATKNTNHKNTSVILGNLYNQINKKFQTDVRKRDGKSVLSSLTKEELEFMLLELFPRFRIKKLNILREDLKNIDRQLSLF